MGVALIMAGLVLGTAPAASAEAKVTLTAELDGVAIPLVDVSKYQCHDLAYPKITCSTSLSRLTNSLEVAVALAAVTYVTIYDAASYGGASMQVSEDYDVLALIGWNDRIGSFKARNSETGSFYTDWFRSGTGYSFCCNQTVPILGGYNNTFSSVYRT